MPETIKNNNKSSPKTPILTAIDSSIIITLTNPIINPEEHTNYLQEDNITIWRRINCPIQLHK